MNMESKNNDLWHNLFAGVHDEELPFNFNEKVMLKIQKEVALRDKKRKYLEIFGYASGIVAMLVVCVFVFSYFEISFELPAFNLSAWTFPMPDYELFKSQSFLFSVYIGSIALFLLIVDSSIRRTIEKNRNKQSPND